MSGKVIPIPSGPALMWLNPGGREMSDEEGGTHFVKTQAVLLSADAPHVRDRTRAAGPFIPVADAARVMQLAGNSIYGKFPAGKYRGFTR